MAYGDHDNTPSVAQLVTYVLSQDEYNKYGVQSVQASIFAVHTATCVDLQATFTTKGANPGQSVTLFEQNVTYDSSGFSKGVWYVTLGATPPKGSPW